MAQIEEVRERLHRLVEQYLTVEAELKDLERDEFRVCICGSARIQPEDETYQAVGKLARSLGELGIAIVTGGGPGLMEAANLGVREARMSRASPTGSRSPFPRGS